MNIIKVSKDLMNNPYNVPNELSQHIPLDIWKAICEGRQSAVMSAHCSSLFMGAVVLYPILIPCMWFLSINGHVESINAKYYKHKPVLSYNWNYLIINPAFIPQESVNPFQVLPPVQSYQTLAVTPVAVATPIDAGVEKAMSGYAGSVTPSSSPPPMGSRQMRITVPPGVAPGSTITAVSPEGTSLSVTIPYNIQPGQSMLVPY